MSVCALQLQRWRFAVLLRGVQARRPDGDQAGAMLSVQARAVLLRGARQVALAHAQARLRRARRACGGAPESARPECHSRPERRRALRAAPLDRRKRRARRHPRRRGCVQTPFRIRKTGQSTRCVRVRLNFPRLVSCSAGRCDPAVGAPTALRRVLRDKGAAQTLYAMSRRGVLRTARGRTAHARRVRRVHAGAGVLRHDLRHGLPTHARLALTRAERRAAARRLESLLRPQARMSAPKRRRTSGLSLETERERERERERDTHTRTRDASLSPILSAPTYA